ncbi:MAG: NUDIX hydrolase [Candidatus Levybacteria bacterium]|nr:NUDIX hydrolase [Candidatus Levybacteria bacterium]
MKTRICVVAVIEKDGKILMGNKARDIGPYPNTWRLPGGGVEERESLEDAIKREIKEETNLDVEKVEKIGVYEDEEPDKDGEMTHYVFNVFKVKSSGKYAASEEFPSLEWVDKKQLVNTSLARPSIKLFKELGYL